MWIGRRGWSRRRRGPSVGVGLLLVGRRRQRPLRLPPPALRAASWWLLGPPSRGAIAVWASCHKPLRSQSLHHSLLMITCYMRDEPRLVLSSPEQRV